MIRVRGEEVLLDLKPGLQGLQNLGGGVSQKFSNLFNAYSKAYNKMYHRKSSLFIPNFRRKRIDSESSVCALVVYIHGDPIHEVFSEDIDQWL